MRFLRVRAPGGVRLAAEDERGVATFPDGAPQDYLALWRAAEARSISVGDLAREILDGRPRVAAVTEALEIPYLPPEVWGAAFTYAIPRPSGGRDQEAAAALDRTDRPVLFFKATPHRCVGPGQAIGSRQDARQMIPEPELAVIIGLEARIIGYLGANDVSSRDLPRHNPFYMDVSKIFARCCALGPAVVPPGDLDPRQCRIMVRHLRGGRLVFEGEGTTARLRWPVEEQARWVTAHADLPEGAVLCTGSAVSPPGNIHLEEGDVVEVEIEGIGLLRNPVVMV